MSQLIPDNYWRHSDTTRAQRGFILLIVICNNREGFIIPASLFAHLSKENYRGSEKPKTQPRLPSHSQCNMQFSKRCIHSIKQTSHRPGNIIQKTNMTFHKPPCFSGVPLKWPPSITTHKMQVNRRGRHTMSNISHKERHSSLSLA